MLLPDHQVTSGAAITFGFIESLLELYLETFELRLPSESITVHHHHQNSYLDLRIQFLTIITMSTTIQALFHWVPFGALSWDFWTQVAIRINHCPLSPSKKSTQTSESNSPPPSPCPPPPPPKPFSASPQLGFASWATPLPTPSSPSLLASSQIRKSRWPLMMMMMMTTTWFLHHNFQPWTMNAFGLFTSVVAFYLLAPEPYFPVKPHLATTIASLLLQVLVLALVLVL